MSPQAVVALLLCLMLAFPAGAAESILHDSGGGLKILILAGSGAVNSIPSRKVTPPVVEVRDESNRPVESAKVVFELPASGAGAMFPKNQLTQEAVTNARGQATASAYRMNETPGLFKIAVTAYAGDRTGSAEIRQTNSLKEARPVKMSNGGGSLKWILLGVAGAAGVALGIYAATRGDSEPDAAVSSVSVSTGPISVGAPR